MPDPASLLPGNASAAERELEQSIVRAADVPLPIGDLWGADACPPALMGWLAWALSVDDWNPEWSEAAKREAIRQAVEVHRRKGTVAAVKDALQALGFGDGEMIEFFGWYPQGRDFVEVLNLDDGAVFMDFSSVSHGPMSDPKDHWAEWRLRLARAISIAEGAALRDGLASFVPVRSHLAAVDFTEAARLYDGGLSYDGTYSHGVA
ncbi:phage tail protein I [Limimaricola cinnabarinus]|uniref:phage tail protein I n=1 Tax=Limimaricola cinnabarinus TaxID=1125964 RepID=UPI002FE040B8